MRAETSGRASGGRWVRVPRHAHKNLDKLGLAYRWKKERIRKKEKERKKKIWTRERIDTIVPVSTQGATGTHTIQVPGVDHAGVRRVRSKTCGVMARGEATDGEMGAVRFCAPE